MRDIFVVSIGTALLFAGAARAEDSMTNPLAQYLLTDEQIAAKCQHSIAEHVGMNTDGKTQCQRIYEDMRADAQKYQEALAAEAKAIASGELNSACEKDPNQQNCIKSGNETGAHYLAAHQHMVALVTDVQEDLHHLVEQSGSSGGEAVATNEDPPERSPASDGDPEAGEVGGSNREFGNGGSASAQSTPPASNRGNHAQAGGEPGPNRLPSSGSNGGNPSPPQGGRSNSGGPVGSAN